VAQPIPSAIAAESVQPIGTDLSDALIDRLAESTAVLSLRRIRPAIAKLNIIAAGFPFRAGAVSPGSARARDIGTASDEDRALFDRNIGSQEVLSFQFDAVGR
jgi:hypothetical protein